MITSNWKIVFLVGGIGLLGALGSGCRFAGGGSLPSQSGLEGEKATLALTGGWNNGLQTLSLQVQYNEHGSGFFNGIAFSDVQFHAEADELPCPEQSECKGKFVGKYCPQPSGQYQDEDAGCGTIVIGVTDGGDGQDETGSDFVSFKLYGGAFAGYGNADEIQGNIQFILVD